ncbi:hypothetical protein F8M41_011428 [Gigaspora margarita]|uniref:Uncharacterized protein n=1 Tax=Gigaspora margarita TaxID=4874 RepID=A0A8H4ATZ8_GIGMA|nr:hypothetical protein F8M41_011428 [Gigaspora margarita]
MSSNFLAYHVASGLWKVVVPVTRQNKNFLKGTKKIKQLHSTKDNFEKKKRPKLSGNTLFNGGQETDAALPAPSKKRPDLSIKTLL